jgi:hypothetical protein
MLCPVVYRQVRNSTMLSVMLEFRELFWKHVIGFHIRYLTVWSLKHMVVYHFSLTRVATLILQAATLLKNSTLQPIILGFNELFWKYGFGFHIRYFIIWSFKCTFVTSHSLSAFYFTGKNREPHFPVRFVRTLLLFWKHIRFSTWCVSLDVTCVICSHSKM